MAAKQDIADFADFSDYWAVPTILDVSAEPSKDSPLALETIHFLFGRNPAGGVGLFHGLP